MKRLSLKRAAALALLLAALASAACTASDCDPANNGGNVPLRCRTDNWIDLLQPK